MLSEQITPINQSIIPNSNDEFTQDIVLKTVFASHDIKDKNFDLNEAKR